MASLKEVKKVELRVVYGDKVTANHHTFELGMGPCGETVYQLYAGYDVEGNFVVQQHTEVSIKSFIYQMKHIVGRIELVHKHSGV